MPTTQLIPAAVRARYTAGDPGRAASGEPGYDPGHTHQSSTSQLREETARFTTSSSPQQRIPSGPVTLTVEALAFTGMQTVLLFIGITARRPKVPSANGQGELLITYV
jgi:hypothetical protein